MCFQSWVSRFAIKLIGPFIFDIFWSIFINLKQLLRSQVDPPKAAAANAHGSKAANVSWYEVKSVIL